MSHAKVCITLLKVKHFVFNFGTFVNLATKSDKTVPLNLRKYLNFKNYAS